MKILTTIILAFICHFVTAQNKHVSINYRFGSAIENFQIPVVLKTTRLEHRKIRPVWDQGLVVLYSPPLWEKYGIYYNFGGEIFRSTNERFDPKLQTLAKKIKVENEAEVGVIVDRLVPGLMMNEKVLFKIHLDRVGKLDY